MYIVHISTPQKLVDMLNTFNSVKNQFDSGQNRFHDFTNNECYNQMIYFITKMFYTHWGQNLFEVASKSLYH